MRGENLRWWRGCWVESGGRMPRARAMALLKRHSGGSGCLLAAMSWAGAFQARVHENAKDPHLFYESSARTVYL
jgi:hypothetical protein